MVCLMLNLLKHFASLFNPQRSFFQPAENSIIRRNSIVVAYHPLLRELGHAILDSGGNAFDAFVAVTAAQNVIAEGASSLAGPLGVLIYRVCDGKISYLDADFNTPLHPGQYWTADNAQPGKAILVPGAPAGLEALAMEYGNLEFSKLLKPSIELASNGFPIGKMMATLIAFRAKILKATDYGLNTYFRDGEPLKAGDILRLPETANFLTGLAQQGSAYVYGGDWGRRFLEFVQFKGGLLAGQDLTSYKVKWQEPWITTYRAHQLFSCSGHTYGGLWVLLALKTLEHVPSLQGVHYSANARVLEQLVRTARQVWSEPWLLDYKMLDQPDLVYSHLSAEYTKSIWNRVRDRAPAHPMQLNGTHSYQIIVVDRAGNIANGTTTIESAPWAEGYFVEGIPIPCSGLIPWNTAPGERRLSPFSIHIVLKDGYPQFSLGAISDSLVEAAFQLLVNLIDYNLLVQDTVSLPRFGTFPHRLNSSQFALKLDRNWLDPRVSKKSVRALKRRGIRFEQKRTIDTGLGAVVSVRPDGLMHGNTVPLPYISDPFSVTRN
jgi:gamma-glutamyltranspeptidase